MNWIWFSIGAIGGLFLLYAKGSRSARHRRQAGVSAPQKGASLQERVEMALESGNIDEMISILDETNDPILRNALLGQIVSEAYRQRSDEDVKKVFYQYARQHVDEIPGVLAALVEKGQDQPESIDTLKMLAIALEQDGRFDEAMEICEKALSLGLQNGTKTGFEGRLARLTRKRDAQE